MIKLIHFPENSRFRHPWAQRYGLFMDMPWMQAAYAANLEIYDVDDIVKLNDMSAVSRPMEQIEFDPVDGLFFPDPFYFTDGTTTWLGGFYKHKAYSWLNSYDRLPPRYAKTDPRLGERIWLKNHNESFFTFENPRKNGFEIPGNKPYSKLAETLDNFRNKFDFDRLDRPFFAQGSVFHAGYDFATNRISLLTVAPVEAYNIWNFPTDIGFMGFNFVPEILPAGTLLVGRECMSDNFAWLVEATVNGERLLYWIKINDETAAAMQSLSGRGSQAWQTESYRWKTGSGTRETRYIGAHNTTAEKWYSGISLTPGVDFALEGDVFAYGAHDRDGNDYFPEIPEPEDDYVTVEPETGNAQPDNSQPEDAQPDNPQPEDAQPDNPQPDNPQPEESTVKTAAKWTIVALLIKKLLF